MYSITAEPCMESVTCYGMESMQSIVWNQAAGKYTFGDAIRLRQFHTRRRVMPYQACGLNATKNESAPQGWDLFARPSRMVVARCNHRLRLQLPALWGIASLLPEVVVGKPLRNEKRESSPQGTAFSFLCCTALIDATLKKSTKSRAFGYLRQFHVHP